MQGHRVNIRKCPCMAIIAISATQSHITLPHHSKVHDRTMMAPIVASFGRHISVIWAIQLTKLSKHIRRPSTSTAICPELPSLLPFFTSFTLCHWHARQRNQAVRPLRLPAIHRILPPPQPPCHPRPVTVSQKPSWPILVDWCVYFSLNFRCFIHNSHDIILRNYLISPITGKMEESLYSNNSVLDWGGLSTMGGAKKVGINHISCGGTRWGELFRVITHFYQMHLLSLTITPNWNYRIHKISLIKFTQQSKLW